MNLEYAHRWAEALGNDTPALAELYAADGDFCIERTMMDDHLIDTINDRAQLQQALGGLANDDPNNGLGIHTFTVTEYLGDERYGLIHWDYSVEAISTYRGIRADSKALQTKGSTFLQFDADGAIVLESTCINDNPIFQELGLPIMTPHYWDGDFDPAALTG